MFSGNIDGPAYTSWATTKCSACRRTFEMREGYVTMWTGALQGRNVCLTCANYSVSLGRMETRYDWIKSGVPLADDVPDSILADWLEEQGRQADADYVRNREGAPKKEKKKKKKEKR